MGLGEVEEMEKERSTHLLVVLEGGGGGWLERGKWGAGSSLRTSWLLLS